MPLKMYQAKEKAASGGLAGIKNIVAVAAGKGGVGKSTVAVNLARALKGLGHTVGILDTDIYGPSVRKMLPEDRLPGRRGDLLLPALSEGMKVLSLAYFRKEHEAAAIRAPIANGVINQFLHGVDWGSLDYLLIDFPPGTGDIQLTLSQQACLSGAIMVTTPQEVALIDVKKAMSLFHSVKVPIVGIVENMSGYRTPNGEIAYIFGKGGGSRLALEAGLPFLGEIPLDPALCACGDTGRSPWADGQCLSPAAEAFMSIAASVNVHLSTLKGSAADALQKIDLAWETMPA